MGRWKKSSRVLKVVVDKVVEVGGWGEAIKELIARCLLFLVLIVDQSISPRLLIVARLLLSSQHDLCHKSSS